MIVDVLKVNHQFKYVVIAMDSTEFYGIHLANYLSANDLPAPFSVRVYCLNPKEVKNYKKSFNNIGKNDGIDSFVIADFSRVGRISIRPWLGSQYLALQQLTRHRIYITKYIAREKTYMLNNIFLKFREYALLRDKKHPFSNKYSNTAEAILQTVQGREESQRIYCAEFHPWDWKGILCRNSCGNRFCQGFSKYQCPRKVLWHFLD